MQEYVYGYSSIESDSITAANYDNDELTYESFMQVKRLRE